MSWLSNLQTTTRFQDYDTPLSVPGCWSYPDMLEVGRVVPPLPAAGMTWNRAHFGAWCIISGEKTAVTYRCVCMCVSGFVCVWYHSCGYISVSERVTLTAYCPFSVFVTCFLRPAPLILGLELTDAKLDPILDIIGNKAAIKVNQAWAGHPGMLVQNIIAPPQHATAGGAKLTVPSDSPGDFGTEDGADISSGRADAATSGSSDIRTGGPGGTGSVTIGTGVLGVPGAMSIASLSMSFRYLAGYTPGPGQDKKAPVVTVQFRDEKTGKVLASVWTSQPLGNYSWDHGDPNSPAIPVEVAGLDVPLSETAPVILVLSVANNDRNLQIPIDDKAGGMHVQLGFGAGGSKAASSKVGSEPPQRPPFVGIAPYHGTVPTGAGQLWAKPQPSGGLAVLLINHGGKKIDSFSVQLQETLNLTKGAVYDVTDVWTQASRKTATGGAKTAQGNLTFVDVDPYDSHFLLLTPA